MAIVIGDPGNLKKAVTLPGGYVEKEILAFNLGFLIDTADEIDIPAYKSNITFDYARPVEEAK